MFMYECYATVSREIQNVFVHCVVFLISEFKILIQLLKFFSILKYGRRPNFIFFEKIFFEGITMH
jgi:hypothetical protein